jgi:hypothetical protein
MCSVGCHASARAVGIPSPMAAIRDHSVMLERSQLDQITVDE